MERKAQKGSDSRKWEKYSKNELVGKGDQQAYQHQHPEELATS